MAAFVRAYFDGRLDPRTVNQRFLDRALRALTRYYGDGTARAVRKAATRIRPHAPFFKWVYGGKQTEELGIVRTLIEAVGAPITFRSLRPGDPDPPDVEAEREDGALAAIEVTELVDEEVTGHNVRVMRETVGQDPFQRMRRLKQRVWDEADFVAAIDDCLREKDGKKLNGKPFAEYLVAIHTDEPLLMHADAERWLRGRTFDGMRQVTGAYLLFSYDGDGYPYFRLSVTK